MYEKQNGEILDRNWAHGIGNGLCVICLGIFGCASLISGIMTDVGVYAIFPGIFTLILNAFFLSQLFAKYKFNKAGVTVKYPCSAAKLVPWSEFQQVCICYTSYSKLGEAFVVIACVKHGEKKNLFGRWKTDNPFRHRRVITMDYTDELYQTIKENCPYEVVDLRKTRSYSLH